MKKVIATPDAPKAVGPYSQAIEVNGTLYISGQIPVNPADGKVQEDIVAAAHQSLKNIGAILKEAGMDYDNVECQHSCGCNAFGCRLHFTCGGRITR